MKKIVSSLIVFFLFSAIANASDGVRSGLILSLGVGGHSTTIVEGSDSESGLATSFKIGYGFGSQFSLYYLSNVAWFSKDYTDGYGYTESNLFTSGIAGLGASYYFSPNSESLYLSAAYGFNSFNDFSNGEAIASGTSMMLGLGYSTGHLQFEVDYIPGTLSENSIGDPIDVVTESLMLTINYLWYSGPSPEPTPTEYKNQNNNNPTLEDSEEIIY